MKGRVETVIVTTREALGEFRAEFDGEQLNLYGNSGNSHMNLTDIGRSGRTRVYNAIAQMRRAEVGD